MKKVIGYAVMGFGVLLIVPAWCEMGEGSIYRATMRMPGWVLAVIGFGLVGLGNFIQGPSRAEPTCVGEAGSWRQSRRSEGTEPYEKTPSNLSDLH